MPIAGHTELIRMLNGRIGTWWEPGSQVPRLPGALEVSGAHIILVLSIDVSETQCPYEDRSSLISELFGIVDGKAITLVNCLVTNHSLKHRFSLGAFAKIEVRPDFVLIGDEHKVGSATFSIVSFATNELHKIFHVHPLKHFDPSCDLESFVLRSESRLGKAELARSKNALVEIANLNCFQSDIPSIGGSVSFQFSGSSSFNRDGGPSLTYEPRLHIELKSDASAYRLFRIMRQANQLLSLLSLTPNYHHGVALAAGHEGEFNTFSVLQNGKFEPRESSELHDFQVLVRFPKHSNLYPDLWARWFSTMEHHAAARWVFSSSLERDAHFDVDRFLNVMRALEILGNIYSTGTLIDKTVFEKFCTAVEGFVEAHEHRDLLKISLGMLKKQNRPPLAARLEALCGRLDDRVLRWLLGDWRKTIAIAVQARNHFNHYGDVSKAKRDLIEENLAVLTCKMTCLYALLEFDVLGFPPQSYIFDVDPPWLMRSALSKQIFTD